MKKLYPITFLFVVALVAIFNRAHSDSNKPPVGRAGAPSSYATCYNGCHNGTAVNAGGGSVVIGFSDTTHQYVVGQQYTVTVTVNDPALTRKGFEIVALTGALTQAGSFTVTNTGTTSTQTSGSKQYIGHKSANTSVGSWNFTWTAPATAPAGGRIVFYATGNAANNNGSDSGDHIYTDSLVLTEYVACTPPTVSISATDSVLTANATGATSYQWYVDGNLINGATSATYIASVSGSYTVEALAGAGCTATSAAYQYTAPEPNGINDVVLSSTVQVFPSVAQGSFNIFNNSGVSGLRYAVYDLNGRMEKEGLLNNGQTTITTNDMASGVHFVRVYRQGQSMTMRIVTL